MTLSKGPFDPARQVWSLARDGDRMLAGTKPAMLWESHDQGESWAKLPALTEQPGADEWPPGAAGLVLHTILCGGQGRVWVGISPAGACATADGGVSWERRTRRSKRPEPAGAQERHRDGQQNRAEGEIFACVHNIPFGAADGLICMQNHQGVYRSRDGGGAWEEITEGLPSTFGFPVVAAPRDPGTLWVFPLNGGSLGRYPVDAVARVWRSHDGGESWQGFGKGLPPPDFFATVLRQGLANDRADPAGVHYGTNSGSVFASRDEGKSWSEIAHHLPTMLSVEVMRQGVCRWGKPLPA